MTLFGKRERASAVISPEVGQAVVIYSDEGAEKAHLEARVVKFVKHPVPAAGEGSDAHKVAAATNVLMAVKENQFRSSLGGPYYKICLPKTATPTNR